MINSKGFVALPVLIFIVALAIAAGGYLGIVAKKAIIPGSIACTEEAMQCPDGSYVGRTGSNCEFNCPNGSTTPASTMFSTEGWSTYRNEKYGFEFKYPSTWRVQPGGTIGFEFSLGINYPEGYGALYIYKNVAQLNINDLKNKTRNSIGGDYENFSLEDVNYNGISAFVHKGKWVGGRVECVPIIGAIIVPPDNQFYFDLGFVRCRFSDETEPEIITTSFNQILSTFKFIPSTGTRQATTGVLAGKVSVGPICPVERIGVPCPVPPEVYTSPEFLVLSNNQSKTIISFHADASGNYSVSLPPGTSDVVVSAKSGFGYMSNLPDTITIKAGETTVLDINVDIGIRSPFSIPVGTVDTSSWRTYRNEKYGFEVKYPEVWQIKECQPFYIRFGTADEQKLSCSYEGESDESTAPPPEQPPVSIAVGVAENFSTSTVFWFIKNNMSSSGEVSEINIAEHRATVIRNKNRGPDNSPWFADMIVLMHPNLGEQISLQLSYAPVTRKNSRPDIFDAMLSTFKFLK